MTEWKECKLGDFIELHRGYDLTKNSIIPGNYPVVCSTSIMGYHNEYKVKAPGVVIGRSGTLGEVQYIDIDFWPHNTSLYVSDFKGNNPKFVKYFLQKFGTGNVGSGSAVPTLNRNHIQSLTITIPPLETQKKIAKILSSLDDKIENNNKINTNLEQQAQALFKSWFIDFDPFGGKMPAGWKMGKLSEIAEITMGQSPDGKSYNEDGIGTVFYQGRAEFGIRFPTRRLFTTEPKRMAKKFDTLMSVRAPVGDTNIANEDCCIGRGLAAIHSNDNHQSFIHYTVLALRSQLDVFNGEGTVFGCINRDALNNMEVVIPSKSDLDKFEQIVASLDADIFNRSEENRNLTNLRDTLLPKLMSGEIEVDSVQI
ncbi:MAG: restriction endonuclease subunit S [Treponema sp.]|nr:restriction endonuclease subunit S [Treponema sp.]